MEFLIFGVVFSLVLVTVTFIGAINERMKWRRIGFMLMSTINAFDAGIFFAIIVNVNKFFGQ